MYFCNLWDLRIHLHLSNSAWHFKLDCLLCCPILSGLTDAATAHAACLYVFNMAQSNHGRWRKKKDVKWRGGYIPPVLHSFLNNVLKVNQKEKQIIKISTFKFHLLWSSVAMMLAATTMALKSPTLFILARFFCYFVQIVLVV